MLMWVNIIEHNNWFYIWMVCTSFALWYLQILCYAALSIQWKCLCIPVNRAKYTATLNRKHSTAFVVSLKQLWNCGFFYCTWNGLPLLMSTHSCICVNWKCKWGLSDFIVLLMFTSLTALFLHPSPGGSFKRAMTSKHFLMQGLHNVSDEINDKRVKIFQLWSLASQKFTLGLWGT